MEEELTWNEPTGQLDTLDRWTRQVLTRPRRTAAYASCSPSEIDRVYCPKNDDNLLEVPRKQ